MLPVIEKAREYGLLEEDEYVVFDPGAEFYKGLYSDDIKYYLDETIFAVLWKEVIDGKSCSLAEVKIADASQLRRKLADDTFGGYNQYYASDLAVSANAVVAMNADYYLFRDFMPLCDRWILCDNSEDRLEIVAESSEAGITVRNPETFGKIKSVNYEYEKELREEGKKRNV